MDNTPFIVSYYPARPKSPWKLEIRKRFAGKKIRRFFDSEIKAYEEGVRLTGQIQEKGTSSLESGGMSVSAAIKRFWAIQGPSIMGKIHKKHLERVFKLFNENYGARGINSINPTTLHNFWNREEWPEGKSTRWQAYCYLRILFNFLDNYELIDKNPIRKVRPPKKPNPLTDIVTPQQMKELIHLPKAYQKAFICLGGFAGLRSSEALRVNPKRDFHWHSKEIQVVDVDENEAVIGIQRYVKMTSAFIRHCPKKFEFPNQRNFYKSMRLAVAGTSIKKLPQNALRHSWFTYYLAKSKNTAVTAHEGGNSEKMVKDVYALPAKRAKQEAFWKL